MYIVDDRELAKQAAGEAAAHLIEDGMLVGLGTGTTARYFIDSLIKRCQKGLRIKAIATSRESDNRARAGGIPMLEIKQLKTLDVTVDGADEVDKNKQLIKGGGGALLREKVLASLSREMIVIVDKDKLVERLGAFPLPLEILPFAHDALLYKIQHLGYNALFRRKPNGQLFVTDNGNYIIDIHFPSLLDNPEKEHTLLRNIPGVLETGFFLNMASRLIVG